MANQEGESQGNKDALVAFRLSEDEKQDLKALALIRRVSLSELIRNNAINDLLEEAARLRRSGATA